ncbi:MAG: ATP-dependent DNA helicase RecG [Parcubacteria group bacterium]|nr:ATP-dependent DNA helicase RecG [Parcubacteria group bacterium]
MSDISPSNSLGAHVRLQGSHKTALVRLGIDTVADLLYHFPARYHHIANMKRIVDLQKGDEVIIYGTVVSAKTKKTFKTNVPVGEIVVDDGSGKITATWFHQAFAASVLTVGTSVKLAGKVQEKKSGVLYLGNPEFEKTKALPIDVGDSLFSEGEDIQAFAAPVYPETKGITSRFIMHAVKKLFSLGAHELLADPIPTDVLKRYNLPSLATALVWIHTPEKEADARAARKRFAFEEIFMIQVARAQARAMYHSLGAYSIAPDENTIVAFTDTFPFPLTTAQEHAIVAIIEDMGKDEPMTRLLEGDVGSGKTVVAAATAYAVVITSPEGQDFGTFQVAYMAPTEILASQHFTSFQTYFKHLPIRIGLITGSGCKVFPSKSNPEEATNISRAQLLKWVANGEIAILFGTHALIQKSVSFKHFGYAIIDEQHRFGTAQREKLVHRDGDNRAPHLLSMTATPIPRTLALTIYGDLDLTLLDELPAGRKSVHTSIITPDMREKVYDHIKTELAAGRQAYVICPRIDEPDPDKRLALNTKSVKAEAARLSHNIFPDHTIDILHGKMKPKEKDSVMARFSSGEIDILVATSVVEVGVNVPNATLIVIEGAERFGLAQLHQLRGRVQRSSHQAYCYLFTDTNASQSLDRLNALVSARDGFALAEMDLSLRGAGELSGDKQWGISDIGMEAIKNLPLVEAARKEATLLLEKDPHLTNHPEIKKAVDTMDAPHLE